MNFRHPGIPEDVYLGWSRKFSFFGTYLIAYQHVHVLRPHLGIGFRRCFFVSKKGEIDFYRSRQEEARFNRFVGEKCLSSKPYLLKLSKRLLEKTDEIHRFQKKHKKLTSSNITEYLQLLDDHFPYHFGTYWAADYISTLPQNKTTKLAFTLLDRARKYNETILPDIEKWLKPQKNILQLTRSEILKIFASGTYTISTSELLQRKTCAYVRATPAAMYVSSGKKAVLEARKLEHNHARIHQVIDTESIRGMGACGGTFTGKVRNVATFQGLMKVRKGDVVVTRMTAPQYNVYLRKAGAIVTDEGAMLSHAAILARESRIPCVVGTKVATKVLHTGDLVEIDADNGLIQKIT